MNFWNSFGVRVSGIYYNLLLIVPPNLTMTGPTVLSKCTLVLLILPCSVIEDLMWVLVEN